ncbi:hypothetical protein CV102_19520 [Natronococcus pandeyae]|uniref:DUF1508 domain-containing protein n=1 Tax=Natronococcus pandeyae TaxID=2055836 RepID=A0A8J8Q041_9EURY|nr:YegP family protein [Natronococcus pandeyae]TYL36946.1 hypothetical protein CV102_19520 [Natronococcus pandeyae]
MSSVRKLRLRTGGGSGLLLGGVSAGALGPAGWPAQSPGLPGGVLATGLVLFLGLIALGLTMGSKYLADDEAESPAALVLPTGDDPPRTEFAVRRNETDAWQLHVVRLEPLATGETGSETRPAATARVEQLQASIETAGVVELSRAAFRLTETRDGAWQWTLVRADGSLVSASSQVFDERDAAGAAVSYLQEHGPTAGIVEIEGAAITYTEAPDGWHWRLVDDERNPLATGEVGFESQDRAADAARTFTERIAQASVLDIEGVGVELYDGDDGWAWRVVDETDEIIADAAATFETRRAAEAAVESILPEVRSAAITAAGEPAYERYRDETGWRWRLVDATDRVLARASDGCSEAEHTAQATATFSTAAPDADVVEIDGATYECYLAAAAENDGTARSTGAGTDDSNGADTDGEGNAWHWQLVTEDREPLAVSTASYADADAAAAAIDRVREQAREAELLEFETAVFQVYESESGTWRWRLLDEDGSVLADSSAEHDSQSEATEAMLTLKEQAPDADVLEIETAAFELFVTTNAAWRWRLIDSAGSCVAEGPTSHPTRERARHAMERLLEHVEADVCTIDQPVFQLDATDGWHWRFVRPSGETIAVGAETAPTRDILVERLEAVRETATAAQDYTLEGVTIQLYNSGNWHWRLLDRDREVLAESTGSYAEREAAVQAVETLKQTLGDATVFAIEDAALRLDDTDGWRWELVTRERELRASANEAAATRTELMAAIEDVRRLAPLADSISVGNVSFDLVATEDERWRWRLLDEDGATVVSGAHGHESKAAARETIVTVRELLDQASVLDHESVTFELHTAADGWRWQLVDAYGETMLESTRTYATRTAAREAIADLKAQAPDGELRVTE